MTALDDLQQEAGVNWSHIMDARVEAELVRSRLGHELDERSLVPADTAVVGFGSLARDEWTSGSDLDWTLLIDGQVSTDHLDAVQSIRGLVEELGHKGPGPSAVFGGAAFSHDIVHRIGGDLDTNRITTQRVLLLLESAKVRASSEVRSRISRALLQRYVGEDLYYRASPRRLPRFLLNDVVRYWRTMAVDYAQKRQERGDGWALRNIKLRMSRKLIFAAGLWMCLSCEVRPSPTLADVAEDDADAFEASLIDHLVPFISKPPLEILAGALRDMDAAALAGKIFGPYDQFLAILDNREQREHLKGLAVDEAAEDSVFKEARQIAGQFQDGLAALFFGTDDDLTKAAQTHGVF